MNIIIIGCGKVGRTLAEQLSNEKHNIVIMMREFGMDSTRFSKFGCNTTCAMS